MAMVAQAARGAGPRRHTAAVDLHGLRLSRIRDLRHHLPKLATAPDAVVLVDWGVMAQKNGASALGLQRVLGWGQYRTAWTWLHKLPRAMVRLQRARLS